MYNPSTFAVNDHSFQFSVANESHAKELFSLVNGGYSREATRKEGTTRLNGVEDVASAIRDTGKIFWLVLQQPMNDGSLALIGSLQVSKEGDKYSLGPFAIDPKYRPFKLGSKMLAEAEKYLTANKVGCVYLDVISVAKKPLNSTEAWTSTEADIEAEEDSLANFYKANGFVFTSSKTIPSLKWLEETRKPELRGRVFLREMKKTIQVPKEVLPVLDGERERYLVGWSNGKPLYFNEDRSESGLTRRLQDGFSST